MGQLVSKKVCEKAREEERAEARSDAIDHQIIEDSIWYNGLILYLTLRILLSIEILITNINRV
jgi:hypothetical protein